MMLHLIALKRVEINLMCELFRVMRRMKRESQKQRNKVKS